MLAAKSQSQQQAPRCQHTRESLVGATLDPSLPAPLRESHRQKCPERQRPDHPRAEFAAAKSGRRSQVIRRLQTRESLVGATLDLRLPAPLRESYRQKSPKRQRPDHPRAEFAAAKSGRRSLVIRRLQTRESLSARGCPRWSLMGATPNPRHPAPVQEGRP